MVVIHHFYFYVTSSKSSKSTVPKLLPVHSFFVFVLVFCLRGVVVAIGLATCGCLQLWRSWTCFLALVVLSGGVSTSCEAGRVSHHSLC